MPLTPPGYKIWENTVALTTAGSPYVSTWYDTTGYTTVLITCVIANSTGSTTYTMEGSFDGSTLDSTMTFTISGNTASTAAGGTSVVVQHPYVRFRVVQATANATTSTFFVQSRA
jgi:hypothetical protein